MNPKDNPLEQYVLRTDKQRFIRSWQKVCQRWRFIESSVAACMWFSYLLKKKEENHEMESHGNIQYWFHATWLNLWDLWDLRISVKWFLGITHFKVVVKTDKWYAGPHTHKRTGVPYFMPEACSTSLCNGFCWPGFKKAFFKHLKYYSYEKQLIYFQTGYQQG